MSWTTVRVRPGISRDAVVAALFELGSQGVHEDGEHIVTHFDSDLAIASITAGVLHADPDAEISVSPLPDTDWAESWKKGLGAHVLGRLTIAPPWLAHGLDRETTIVIEPEMAFGTGEHPTTRGVVRLMQSVIRRGDRVADLGAGSAVLAIAAARLGAASVAAIESDPDAIRNAEENVARNGVAGQVRVIEGDALVLLPLVAPVRVVLANIISSVIVQLLPAIADALEPGGELIVSGILADERDDMRDVLGVAGWRVLEEDEEDVWWSARAVRR